MKIVVGITGSSGAIYAVDFLRKCRADKFLIISRWGKVLLNDEVGISEKDLKSYCKRQFSNDDLAAPTASGSNKFDAYVIIPCSTSTIGKIASGIGDSLITRTAQVALKQKYRMILCVRETPLSSITLEQCAMLSREGVVIMPISPALYLTPKTVDDLVNTFTNRLLQILNLGTAGGWRAEELE